MAQLQVRETSGILTGIPPAGYALSFPVVASNSLAQVNDFTRDRRSGARRPPLAPDRSGKRTSQRSSRHAGLRSATRVIT